MNKSLVAGMLIAVALVAGYSKSPVPAAPQGSAVSGASYEGGFKVGGEQAAMVAEATKSGNIKAVAGPAGPHVATVKDGESIQAAVTAAEPGTTIQSCQAPTTRRSTSTRTTSA